MASLLDNAAPGGLLSDPRMAVLQQLLDPAVTKRHPFLPVMRTMRPTGDTMVPEEITSREFGTPQIAVDMLESFMLPGAVRKGYTPTMQDAAQFSLDSMLGGGLLGTAPRNSLAANVFRRETKQPSQMTSAELRAEANANRFGSDLDASVPSGDAGFNAYRNRVDPSGRTIPAEDRPNLGMGDMYGMLPKNSKVVGELDDVTLHRGPDGDYYATAYNRDVGDQDVVGYIQGRDNGTDLAVVQEMQGKGIGSELQYLFRSENPFAATGGLTDAGASRLKSTYDRLIADGVTLGANKSPTAATAGLLSRLPMDEQNRMARAEGLGFDFDGFHGTGGKDISEMSGMTWMSESPRLANEYAAMRANSSDGMASQIMPLKARTGNVFNAGFLPKSVTINHMMNEVLDQAQNNLGRTFSDGEMDKARKLLGTIRKAAVREESGPNYSRHDFWNDSESIFGKDGAKAIKEIFRMSGFDSISMREGGENTIGILNPSNIRSRFAAFDPAKANSENILAANAAPLGALSQLPEEAGVE